MDPKLHISGIQEWYLRSYPMVIGGPCSAESEKQVLETAEALSRIPEIGIFRAGIWKPRTRPAGFEGVGRKGLKWLQRVKDETGLMTAVEIGKADHVITCLDHGIDIIWIGARTVVNPFSMQEIARALENTGLPVFIKNPVNPDISIWIGALERINQAGINKLVAVHRGFFSPSIKKYRNDPMWEIPIDLKRLFPDLPIVCDPSHISGHSDLVPEIAQRAIDLGVDGLMIESHIHPEEALTDKEQQITPAQFSTLLEHLKFRVAKGDQDFENELEALREQINQADAELIRVLAKRMAIVERIGRVKQSHNITAFQVKRWNIVREKFIASGVMSGLDKKFLQELLELIHQESIRIQSKLFSDD